MFINPFIISQIIKPKPVINIFQSIVTFGSLTNCLQFILNLELFMLHNCLRAPQK